MPHDILALLSTTRNPYIGVGVDWDTKKAVALKMFPKHATDTERVLREKRALALMEDFKAMMDSMCSAMAMPPNARHVALLPPTHLPLDHACDARSCRPHRS